MKQIFAFALVQTTFCIFVGAFASAQSPARETDERDTRYDIIEDPRGVVLSSAIWPTRLGELDVCWADPLPRPRKERAEVLRKRKIVRDVVRSTIEAETRLKFDSVWPPCETDAEYDVRIAVIDSESTLTAEVGRQLDGPTDVRLAFSFHAWQRSLQRKSGLELEDWPFINCRDDANVDQCIASSALHEFGHVVGLLHEMGHPSLERGENSETAEAECLQLLQKTFCAKSGGQSCGTFASGFSAEEIEALTEYDPDSFMNYCRPGRFQMCTIQDGVPDCTLSDLDKSTLRQLYCPPGNTPCTRFGE
ncbi:hypothetical protein GCM10007148_27870 [Parvularcula lutaonensis]|nr:hypothetical protein GCM10007148_27870 [Parvularcula lutaonensis]